MGSWHLPLRPSPPPSPRLTPMPSTAMEATVLVATMVATGLTVSDTVVVSTPTARGRLRLSPRLMPTTDMEDTDTVSDTGATEDTVSDTAVLATSTVRFCLDVLDLDATTLCPWIGSRRI